MSFGNMIAIFALCFSFYSAWFTYKEPRFVTISVPAVIESQSKVLSRSLHGTVEIDKVKIRSDVEKYSRKISETVADYARKNNLIIFEKGSILATSIVIDDITDEFIKAINN